MIPAFMEPAEVIEGMTETCTIVSTWSIETKRGLIGSAGQLLAGVTVRVVKPDASPVDDGEPGELIVKSPSNAIGYYNNLEAYVELARMGILVTKRSPPQYQEYVQKWVGLMLFCWRIVGLTEYQVDPYRR